MQHALRYLIYSSADDFDGQNRKTKYQQKRWLEKFEI